MSIPAPLDHHDALLQSALDLLSARQNRMVTIVEWVALARAVAACQANQAAAYLTDDDLADIREYCSVDWN